MCWIGKNTQKFRAEEDIPCFKMVLNNLKSIYQNFQYEVSKVYHTELKPLEKSDERIEISEGFHCWVFDCSFMLPDVDRKELTVLMCKIPKGAIYYKDDRNVAVTSKIVIENAIPYINCLKEVKNESRR